MNGPEPMPVILSREELTPEELASRLGVSVPEVLHREQARQLSPCRASYSQHHPFNAFLVG